MAAKGSRLCTFFSKNGTCKYGDKCHFRHERERNAPHEASPPLNRTSCRLFNTPEGCPDGNACKYLHEHTAHTNLKPKSQVDPTFRNWLYMIPRDLYNTRELSEQDLSKFFQQALCLVETKDHSIQQQVVTKLASDGGLQRIKEMAKYTSFENFNTRQQIAIFNGMLYPFFQLFAWKGVSQSLILEDSVHRIVNFLFGPGGQRGISVFKFSINVLLSIFAKDVTAESSQSIVNVEPFLAVFNLVIKLNQTAQIIPEFADMSTQLLDNPDYDRLFDMGCRRLLSQIQKRLNLGSEIPDAAFSTFRTTTGQGSKPTFELRQDAPGWLSEEGPRHDNDFDDITKIQLMPTADEIRSPREEYLPRNDLTKLHLPGWEGLIDRQFRLLREDTVGQLRDAVRLEIEHQSATVLGNTSVQRKHPGARTQVYRNGQVVDITVHKWKGLQITYAFPQPAQGQSMEQRKTWWHFSKRLQNGALVCLLDSDGSPLFCSISVSEADNDPSAHATGPPKRLFENPQLALVTLSLVTTDNHSVEALIERFQGDSYITFEVLIEFPGVLLAAFAPTLTALQTMSTNQELPFGELIAPETLQQKNFTGITPPMYSLKPGFNYDLSCLTSSHDPLLLKPRERFDLDILQSRTTLDTAQARALVDALSRSLALIQGPPGTGKSFTGIAIIKVLLAAKKKAKLGPIICVTYTNHALDQLLEQLVEGGVEQIIRVGSRSKSEMLQNLTLRHIKSNMEETKTEKARFWDLRKELDGHVDELQKLLQRAKNIDSIESIEAYLAESHPHHHHELFSLIDEEGFQKIQYRPENTIKAWLQLHPGDDVSLHVTPRPLAQLLRSSLLIMSFNERAILHQHWLLESWEEVKRKLSITVEAYVNTKALHDKIKQELDLRALQQASVIGVTTSGLARVIDILRRLESKVLVCEEAGEILESHTLTALLPTIEHAIFIGDHLQLRPQTQNYELQRENPRGRQYSLDVSLFERLVDPQETAGLKLPFSTLEMQRRMHPLISRLIRKTLYPSLVDHGSVHIYPEVSGMRRRLFWLDHRNQETAKDMNQPIVFSHSNEFEVEMTASLVSHLIKQSIYKQGEIAVLTPYLGQLQKLRRRLSQFFEVMVSDRDLDDLEAEGFEPRTLNPIQISKTTLLKAVRVATVDNFQGEEAKVVIISLVRSNEDNKCGFLRTSNRINVLLSRAKHGMYIIGNSNTARTVSMWNEVIRMLEDDGNIGLSLELNCLRHSQTPIAVATPDDFSKFAPDGGCALVCGQRLLCGHRCKMCCHSEILHLETYCSEPCTRSLNCEHPCPKACGDACPKCKFLVKVTLPCGHMPALPCHVAQDPQKALCPIEIRHKMADCGHKVVILCGNRDRADLKCEAVCNAAQTCGHLCKKPCKDCTTGKNKENPHGICEQICGRAYTTCNHTCPATCHDGIACGPCQAPCEVRCSHSACNKKCHEPCAPCAEETCDSQCPHSQCSMPCAAPCDWIPCSQRCSKTLSCGHRCPSVCGETCPEVKYCQICASESVKAQPADLIMLGPYGDVELDEDPCIFPDCGHVFTLSSLDGTMHMAEHYEMDKEGKPFRLTRPSAPFTIKDGALRTCPHCRGSLRTLARYGRIVRRSLLDESHKKFIVWSNTTCGELAERMESREKELADADDEKCFAKDTFSKAIYLIGPRKNQIGIIQALSGLRTAMRRSLKFLRELNIYLDKVSQEEQPYHRVWELVKNAQRRGKTARSFDFDDSVLHTRCISVATVMVLRWELSIISKIMKGYQDATKGPLTGNLLVNLEANRDSCRLLIHEAEHSKQPSQQVEGHMLLARFAALELTSPTHGSSDHPLPAPDAINLTNRLREQGNASLDSAEELCRKYPNQTRGMNEDIAKIRQMLRGSTFYTLVTNEERMAVIRAMATEFSGTGHWYYCANGHPFTIGECGMPMQLALCSQCGTQIGGTGHQAVEGVRLAEDWDGGLQRLHIE